MKCSGCLMANDVFISHSSKDKLVADAVCATLESGGIRCWVAPRDVTPGVNWSGALIQAISDARIMVLVFSSNSNHSPQVMREAERAVSKGIPILTLRMEDVKPSDDMEFFISATHWLDAMTPPVEQHLQRLARSVSVLLAAQTTSGTQTTSTPTSTKPKEQTQPVAAKKADTAPSGPQVPLTSSVGTTLVPIPPGSFMMGSPASETDRTGDESQVQVTLTRPFWMAAHECTQQEWETVMGSNPSRFKGPRNPVERVSWKSAMAFCVKLTQMDHDGGSLAKNLRYSLPTEAQWEYACRAGTTTPFGVGDGANLDSMQANFDGDAPYGSALKGPARKSTMDVGSFPPNEWGLHDMHGNVWEWCLDTYGKKLRGGFDPITDDGSSPFRLLLWFCRTRVIRGGSWNNGARSCRSANRSWYVPTDCGNSLGFRVAVVPVKP